MKRQQTIDEQILTLFRIMEGPAAQTTTIAQIRKAAEEIGRRPEDRLRWALTFVNQELDSFSSANWLDVTLKLAAFRVNPFRLFGMAVSGENLPVGAGVFFPSREQIGQIHAGFNRLFDEYVSAGQTIFEYRLPAGKHTVDFALSHVQEGKSVFSIRVEDYAADCIIKLMRLMEDFAHLIRTCPPKKHGCGRVFLATRIDNIYCSSACVNRSTTRERRARMRSDRKRRVS